MGIDHFVPLSAETDATLMCDLVDAIDLGGLHMVYQPKFCVRDGLPCGAEALIRWQHPVLGPVPPSTFIPLAETNGLIGQIGQWTLDQCCRLLATARDRGVSLPRIAVNLSPIELLHGNIADRVAAAARRHGVSPHQLELEITETAVISDPVGATLALEAVRALGTTVAIDDFGTGYSALAYLKRLPIDVLKLDRSFVAEIDSSPVDRRIVRTVVALAHTLGLTVVAEGVERQSQAELLAKCRVDVVQGFHYARPLSGSALLDAVQRAGFGCAQMMSAVGLSSPVP